MCVYRYRSSWGRGIREFSTGVVVSCVLDTGDGEGILVQSHAGDPYTLLEPAKPPPSHLSSSTASSGIALSFNPMDAPLSRFLCFPEAGLGIGSDPAGALCRRFFFFGSSESAPAVAVIRGECESDAAELVELTLVDTGMEEG